MNNNRRMVVAQASRRVSTFSPEQKLLNNKKNQKLLSEITRINNQIVKNNWYQDPPLMVSYCTTCYNRFWQLKKVLKKNLDAVKSDPYVEFIVVDFNGDDSEQIKKFIETNFAHSLSTGRLKYFRRATKDFVWNVAVAKNVAHLLASGDILVNLDGDNFLQADDSQIIRYYHNKISKLIFQQTWCNFALINIFNSLRLKSEKFDVQPWTILSNNRGTFGRISIKRTDFMKLGGYNEKMVNMGAQDTDLIFRATNLKYQYLVSVPRSDGSDLASIVNKSDIKSEQLRHNRSLTHNAYKKRQFVVNPNGFKEDLLIYQRSEVKSDVQDTLVDDNLDETESAVDEGVPEKLVKLSKTKNQTTLCEYCGEIHSDEE